MVTRGDEDLDTTQSYCTCNDEDMLLRYFLLEKPKKKIMIWGWKHIIDTLTCDDNFHPIYDSGLEGDVYSNNENGYLVLYPGDPRAKLKLWGDSKLKYGDTLFIYNGNLYQNPNLEPHDTIVGQQNLGNEINPIFISDTVNWPITLRMQSDSSCTWDGLNLRAKCCLNPGLPTDLTGNMTSDTTALLTWNPAEGNDLHYNWTLYTSDSVFVSEGTTQDTFDIVSDLNPNECYFFTIAVQSACSMESGADTNGVDIVYSNVFCYPYFVTLGEETTTFDFNTDTLFVPDGAHIDSSWTYNIIIHQSEMHVCYGDTAQICYNFPENANGWRQLIWRTNYLLDTTVAQSMDSFVPGDTNVYYSHALPGSLSDCFPIGPMTENGYVLLDAYTAGNSLARAILHLIVDTIPNVFITIDGIDTAAYASCESQAITFLAHGANGYLWGDTLGMLDLPHPPEMQSSLLVAPIQNNMYYVTGTDSHGCRATDSITSLINRLPDLQYDNRDTICLGDIVWLHVEGISDYTWIRLDTVRWDTTYLHTSQSLLNKSQLINELNTLSPLDNLLHVYKKCNPSSITDTIIIHSSLLNNTSYIDSILPNSCQYRYGYLATDHLMRVDSYTIAQGEQDSLLVSPRISTDYVITGTDTNGCICRSNAVIHIEVLPHPTILASHSTGVVCAQDTVTLSASVLMDGAYTFRWFVVGDTTDLGTDTLLQYIPDSSTTILFSVYHSNGCDTTAAFPVQVYPHPNITVTAYPDTLCPRQSSTIRVTASGVTGVHWEDGSVSAERTVSPDTNSVYYVQAADEHGCTVTDYVSLYLKPLPDYEFVSNDSICMGMSDTVVLSGAASHYHWLGGGISHNGYGDTMFVTPTVTSEYAVAYDNEYGCWDTTRFSVFVYEFPEPHLSSDTTICRGDTILLTASGGDYFQWNDTMHSTTNALWVSPEDTATYQVTVYDYIECASMGTVTVRVIPYFDLSIATSADTVCPNADIVLTASGGADYIWNGNSSLTGTGYTIHPDSTTVVSLSAANPATNCSRTVYDTLFVYPLPEFHFVSATDTLCSGDSVAISLAGNAASYLWSNGDTAVTIVVAPSELTTYTVTAYSEHQCEKTSDFTVVVNELPDDFTVQVDDYLCHGDSLAVNVTPAFPNVQYIWNYPDISTSTASFFYTSQQNENTENMDTLTLSIVNERGCTRTKSVEIAIHALPEDTISGPTSICHGDSVWLSTSGVYQYFWHQPIPMEQAHNGAVWAIPSQSQNYSVDIVNSHNCHITLSHEVTVNELPMISFSAQGETSFCNNSPYTFTASGGVEYLWSDGQTGESVQMIPDGQTVYSVTGTDINGCVGTRSMALDVVAAPSLSLQVFPQDTICAFDTITLHADGNFSQILWSTFDTTYAITRSDITASTWFYATVSSSYMGNACQTVDSVFVVVNPVPQLSVIANQTPICADDSAVVVVSGADMYSWNPHPYMALSEDSVAVVKPVSSTSIEADTLVVQGFSEAYHCGSVLKIPVVVLPLPDISLQTPSPGYLCNDGNQLLGIAAHSDMEGLQFQWVSFPMDNTMAISQNVAFVSPDTTTTYIVEGYYTVNGVECHAFDTIRIDVYPMPHVTASVYPEIPCRDVEVEMSAIGASQYVWLADNQIVGMGNNVSLIPVTGTQYIVVGTDSNHCVSRDTITVNTVHYPPVDSISGAVSTCAGNPVVLHTTGNNHCEWWPNIGLSELSDSSVTVTLTETTTYSIYITNEYGCRDTLYQTITVFPMPELSLPNDTVICEAAELSFRVSGATSYLWEDGTTNDFRTVFPSLNTTAYSVTGTNQYGCVAADSFLVTVYPAFDLQIAASRDTFCLVDNAITLTAYGAGDTYMWNTGSTDSIIVVYPTATTEYTLTAYNTSSGCQSSITREIVLMDNPDVTITSSGSFLCLNDTAILSVILEPGESVSWSTGDSSSSIHVSPYDTTTYSATVTNAFGCQSSTTYSVNVLPIPQVGILSSDTIACYGQNVTLTAVGDADNYQWSNGEVTQSITISSITDDNIILTGYNSTLCHSSDTTHVSIRPLPSGTIFAPSGTVCPGDTIMLSVNATDEYEWADSSNILAIVGPTTLASPESTMVFTAVMTTPYGCVDSTHIVVSVYEPLPLQITSDTVICYGAGVDITVSGSWNYLWNDGFQGNSQYVTPELTTTYTVSSTDIHDCITSVSTTVTVQPDYAVTLYHDKDTICIGDSVTIWYVGAVDQHYWSTGSTANQISVSPMSDATYSIWAYNTNTSCAKTVFDTIIVIPYPVFMLGAANLICSGDTMSVRAFSDFSFDYQWTSNPEGTILSPPDSAEITVNPIETTAYIYHADNQFCSLADSIVIEVAPLPIISVASSSNETCFQGNGSIEVAVESDYPPFLYQWSTGETNIAEIQNLSAGTYSLTVTDALGCSNSLDDIEIFNIPPPEVSVISLLGAINGGDGSVDIEILNSNGGYTIEWFMDSMDNPLYHYDGFSSIDDLDSGYYFVMVSDEACSTVEQIYIPQLYFGQGNLYVPNTITPSNEDNMNDYFRVYYHGNINFKEILIYNRWGTLVFESKDIDFRWNGSVNGEILYNNVYSYLLYYYDYRGTEHVIKGFLLVL